MTTRLSPFKVYQLFLHSRRNAKGASDVAAQTVYDAGFAAGCAFRSLPRPEVPAQPARAVLAISLARPIIEAVAQRHQTTPEAICATFARGPMAVTGPRDEACWLLRNAGFRYTDIAVALSLKCHTSAMDGVARMEAKISERLELRGELLAVVGGAGERRLKAVG